MPDRFKALHFTRLPGGEVTPEFAQRLRELHAAARSRETHERAARQHGAIAARSRRSTAASLARPRLVHRGNARLLLRPRRGSRRARAPRAAQAPDGAVRPVRPRQDLDPARRPRAAPARARLLPGLRAHRLLAAMRRSPPSRSSRPSSARRATLGQWTQPVSAARASRCGSSCTTATTCCATRPASTLIPLLIFDQFEEIFTLAQATRPAAQRARAFIDDLADLVENRAARGARGEAGARRRHGRALRLRARRLPRADRAARGLPRAAREPEGADAEHHAEPPAARADDRHAGASRP